MNDAINFATQVPNSESASSAGGLLSPVRLLLEKQHVIKISQFDLGQLIKVQKVLKHSKTMISQSNIFQ